MVQFVEGRGSPAGEPRVEAGCDQPAERRQGEPVGGVGDRCVDQVAVPRVLAQRRGPPFGSDDEERGGVVAQVRGQRVTTHWARAGRLARSCPAATVEPDAIYVRDGDLWTSAGVTAGIDLALALVEADVGAGVAQVVARHLVVPLRRAGGQTQYAAPVWSEPPAAGPIRRACDLVAADPGADLSVAALAARVGLSPRHFTRLFRAQVGEAPARHVERVRVQAARQLLLDHDPQGGSASLDVVARRCGFGTPETLRRAFHRRLGLSPDAYRRRFATV